MRINRTSNHPVSDRIAVIGSNSFSGAHFVAYLLDEGHEVMGISRSPEPHPVFLPYKGITTGAFEFHQLDLNHHLDRIEAVIREWRPAYIVNFAAQGMVAESWLHPEQWFQTNTVAHVRLHDRLRKCDFIRKYVHVSTPEVYGACEGLVRESLLYNPSTPYAASKAACDMSLMTFLRAYNFPVVFTRAANVYGPHQPLYRIIPRTILSFLTGRKLPLHGGGRSSRSFIHIGDVAECTWRIAQTAEPGDIFHISTDRLITIRELVELIAQKMGVSFQDHVEITGDRLGKDAAYRLDSSKARERLGWRDRIGLEEGLDQTIDWVKANLDILSTLPLEYVHKE